MPKAKYADRGKVKPKSVKSRAVLSGKKLESRFGKKLKKGTGGASTIYIGRTRAIKKLQLSLRDFRRLCILKGIYPCVYTRRVWAREFCVVFRPRVASPRARARNTLPC